jgi:hypothetical protein
VALVAGLSAWAGACGDDETITDATVDAPSPSPDAEEVPATPLAAALPMREPIAPAAPVLVPCPDGWREVSDGSQILCEPWPDGGRESCAADHAHFPGEPGCAPIGRPADVDGFPAELPAGPTLFVRAGTAAGGDGTRGRPYATIGDAIDVAGPGTTIAIAEGDYFETIRVPDGIALHGASVAGTTLGPPATPEAYVFLEGAGTALSNLALRGDGYGIRVEGPAADARIVDVLVDGLMQSGVVVTDARAVIEGVVIRDLRGIASGAFGRGIQVQGTDADVEVRRSVIERARDLAVFAHASSVLLERVAILETQPEESDSSDGRAVHSQAGARVEIRGTVVDRNRDTAVIGGGAGTELVVRDSVVRATVTNPLSAVGRGIGLEGGSSLRLERVLVQDAGEVGVALSDTAAEMTDVAILDVGGSTTTGYARGITLSETTARAERVLVRRAAEMGIFAQGGTVVLDDVRVEDSGGDADRPGRGLSLQVGVDATLHRLHVERAGENGVFCGGLGAVCRIDDATFRDIAHRLTPDTTPLSGQCASAATGATLELRGALAERCAEAGIVATLDGASIVLEDVTVRDLVGIAPLGDLGRGINIQLDAHGDLTRVLVERGREVAVAAIGGATVEGRDVTIRDTEPRRSDDNFGRGLQAQESTITLTRTLVSGSTDVGVLAVVGGELILDDLVVRDARGTPERGIFGRGACVQGGGRMTIERALIEANRELGLCAFEEGSELVATDFVVTDTLERRCSPALCPGLGAGVGVGVYGAHAVLDGFMIERSALAGLQIARGGELDATRGTVRNNPIGANVQVVAFDYSRITGSVLFEDNGIALDSSELAVPDLAEVR